MDDKKAKLKELLNTKFLEYQVQEQRRDVTVAEFAEHVSPNITKQAMQSYLLGQRFPRGENFFLIGAKYPEIFEIADYTMDEGVSYIVGMWGELADEQKRELRERVEKYITGNRE